MMTIGELMAHLSEFPADWKADVKVQLIVTISNNGKKPMRVNAPKKGVINLPDIKNGK